MSRPPPIPPEERTPQALLTEARLHAIVGYQLAQASIVTDQVFDDQVGEQLRRVEFTLLALVQANPDVSARQLAKALAVTPPNIAVWIDRLAARGMVVRSRSASDARVQHLRLTAQGRQLVDQATGQLLQAEQQALACLSAAERAMLVELLHKVAMSRKRVERGS